MARWHKVEQFVERVLAPFRKSRRTTMTALVVGLLRNQRVGLARPRIYKWVHRFQEGGTDGLHDNPGRRAARPFFAPEVAVYVAEQAWRWPGEKGCRLSQWDCSELARQPLREGIVSSI